MCELVFVTSLDLDTIKILIEGRADASIRDGMGLTPLDVLMSCSLVFIHFQIATRWGYTKIIEYLKSNVVEASSSSPKRKEVGENVPARQPTEACEASSPQPPEANSYSKKSRLSSRYHPF